MNERPSTEAENCDVPVTLGTDAPARNESAPMQPGRRQLLMGGAVAACAIVSIRPALAQSAASVLHCQVPVPDPARSGNMVAPDGSVVAPGTQGAFAGAGRPFTGEEVKAALRNGKSLPGTSYDQNRAYLNYIRRLQSGTSGFTCYASLQMPR
ncbi:MAG: hypothetical protein ABI395_04850 [Sphingobium sp.]